MKKRNSLFIFWLIAVFSHPLYSQVPGYLGRRTSLYFTSGLAPNYLKNDLFPPSTLFDVSFGLGVDHAVTKKISVGLEYKHLNSSMKFDFDNNFEKVENNGHQYYYASKTNIFKFSIAANTFRSEYIAPIGKYYSLNILFLSYNIYDNKNYIFGENYKFYRGGTTAAGLTFGNKHALSSRLIFDYNVSSAYIIVDLKSTNSSDSPLKLDLFNSVNARLQNYFILNGSLALGYLL